MESECIKKRGNDSMKREKEDPLLTAGDPEVTKAKRGHAHTSTHLYHKVEILSHTLFFFFFLGSFFPPVGLVLMPLIVLSSLFFGVLFLSLVHSSPPKLAALGLFLLAAPHCTWYLYI